MDTIALIFPSLHQEFNLENNDEYYFHKELCTFYKFLTKPYENGHNENSTSFSRAKKHLNSEQIAQMHENRKSRKSTTNLSLLSLVLDKLLQRSGELRKIAELTNAFTSNSSQITKNINSKASRKSYGNNLNNVLDFDSVYLLLLEEVFLNLRVLSNVDSKSTFQPLFERIEMLKIQTKDLLSLVGVYLKTSLNNSFESFNPKLNISICNFILSEITLNAYLDFGLHTTKWDIFSKLMIETDLVEIFFDICSFQTQNSHSNESNPFENTQLVDDYEIDQENLNS